jgi:hypothetical protein
MFPSRKRRLGTRVEAEHLEHVDLAILFLDEMEKRRRKTSAIQKQEIRQVREKRRAEIRCNHGDM